MDFVINPKDPDSIKAFGEHFRTHKKPFLIKTETIEKRTIDFNAYYFGVVIEYISDETGEDGLIIHEFLAFKFLRLTKNTRRSTASLNNKEFRIYSLQCRVWALEVLGVKIPLPNETI